MFGMTDLTVYRGGVIAEQINRPVFDCHGTLCTNYAGHTYCVRGILGLQYIEADKPVRTVDIRDAAIGAKNDSV